MTLFDFVNTPKHTRSQLYRQTYLEREICATVKYKDIAFKHSMCTTYYRALVHYHWDPTNEEHV